MEILLEQLGIDWKLLISQGVNFFILLVALTFLVYRPLLRAMGERKKKIELGLRGAEEVEVRLQKIEGERQRIITKADKEAVDIIGKAEKERQKRIHEAAHDGEMKAEQIVKAAHDLAERKRLEDLEKVENEARQFVREALMKTVELDPTHIDEKLIDRAVALVKTKQS